MTTELKEDRRRFAEYIKVQALDDQFISLEAERRIYEQGVMTFELPVDDVRAILMGTATEYGYAMERTALTHIEAVLTDMAAGQRQVSKTQFRQAVKIYNRFCKNQLSEETSRKRVTASLEKLGLDMARGGQQAFGLRWLARPPMEE